MHPQAIRRVLDEEASKWIQSDDDDDVAGICVYPATAVVATSTVTAAANKNWHHRAVSLQPPEVEMIKLIFSLLDTDGSMTLNAAEVSQFVFHILGETITPEVADVYLDALDFDHNGVVDLGDILSWAAVMKANHARQHESVLSPAFLARRTEKLLRKLDPYRGFLWLTVVFIVRDVFVSRRTRLLRSKSLVSLIVIALAVSTVEIVRLFRSLPLAKWCELFPLWKSLAKLRRRDVPGEMPDDEY